MTVHQLARSGVYTHFTLTVLTGFPLISIGFIFIVFRGIDYSMLFIGGREQMKSYAFTVYQWRVCVYTYREARNHDLSQQYMPLREREEIKINACIYLCGSVVCVCVLFLLSV